MQWWMVEATTPPGAATKAWPRRWKATFDSHDPTDAERERRKADAVLFSQQRTTMTTMLTLRTALRSSRITSTLRPSLQKCWYRGDSGEAEHNLSQAEQALLKLAKPKSEKILAHHIRLPVELKDRQKRLIYRSKQRGWLEVDLLLGTWASQHVESLNAEELDQFEDFVNMETIDIYNIITLRLDVPEELKTPDGSGVVERIQEWARNSPLGRADPAKYKEVKTKNNLI